MFGPGRVYDLAGLDLADAVSLSCVAELPAGIDPADLPKTGHPVPGFPGLHFHIPTLYRPDEIRPRFVPFLMTPDHDSGRDAGQPGGLDHVHGGLESFARLAAGTEAATGYFRLNFPVRAETIDLAFPAASSPQDPDPGADGTAPLVVLAIIDEGIPFAHAAFRHPAGTRIDHCWSQGATADHAGQVPFGREFTRAGIDAAIARFGGDEDAIYRAAGLLGGPGRPPMPLDAAQSHGAHVLDLLAGNWPEATAAQVRIIAVDLPATATWETSSFGTDMFMLAGLHYIFERADRIARSCGRATPPPVIVNLSYGYSGGPQDMSGFLETAMDELVLHRRRSAPTALVMPSGNMFQDRLTAMVTEDNFRDARGAVRAAYALKWFAPPDDRTSTFLEIWYPPTTPLEHIRVAVTAPGTDEAANAQEPTVREAGRFYSADLVVGGRIVGQYAIDRHRDLRWRVTVILAPTDPTALPGGGHHAAPAGVWTLNLMRPDVDVFPARETGPDGQELKGVIQARIQIDTNSAQGNTGARQSAFVDPAYEPFDRDGMPTALDPAEGGGVVRRFGSMNGMASNVCSLVVAGYAESSLRPVAYSSAGAARFTPAGSNGAAGPQAWGKQVHLSAPTDRSAWHDGIVAAGTRSGTTAAMRGTSVAAPQAGRRLAERLLLGTSGMVSDAENYLPLIAQVPLGSTPVGPADGAAGQVRLGRLRLRPLMGDDATD